MLVWYYKYVGWGNWVDIPESSYQISAIHYIGRDFAANNAAKNTLH